MGFLFLYVLDHLLLLQAVECASSHVGLDFFHQFVFLFFQLFYLHRWLLVDEAGSEFSDLDYLVLSLNLFIF